MEWNLVIKALGAVTAIILVIFQIRHIFPNIKSDLKTDIEVLHLLKPSDSNYHVIKANIDKRIQDIYAKTDGKHTESTKGEHVAQIILGTVMAVVFAYVTFYIVKDRFTWWSLLTGYLSLSGIGMIFWEQVEKVGHKLHQLRSRYRKPKRTDYYIAKSK